MGVLASDGYALTSGNILAGADRFQEVQEQVAHLMKGKVVVGHSIWHDLSGEFLLTGVTAAKLSASLLILVLYIFSARYSTPGCSDP